MCCVSVPFSFLANIRTCNEKPFFPFFLEAQNAATKVNFNICGTRFAYRIFKLPLVAEAGTSVERMYKFAQGTVQV